MMSHGSRDGNGGADRLAPMRAGWRRWMGFGLLILGLAMATGFGAFVVSLMNVIEEQDRAIAMMRERMEQRGRLGALVESKELLVVSLLPAEKRKAWGRLYVDRAGGNAILQVSGLDQPEGSEYHLWMSGAGNTARVLKFRFHTEPEEESFLVEKAGVSVPSSAMTFVVTIEPEGSGGGPTGTMILAGSTLPDQRRK